MKPNRTFYRRNLPHIQLVGATFFVTFRLYGSIPKNVLYQMKSEYLEAIAQYQAGSLPDEERNALIYNERKRYFGKYDRFLDKLSNGPYHLQKSPVAETVAATLHRFDGEFYTLLAYCIMPNHVHILIDTAKQIEELSLGHDPELGQYVQLETIMKRIKGPTAVECNRILHLSGRFWQREHYDHYVRNEKEQQNILTYIVDNPVKAGFVEMAEDWPYSFVASTP